MQTYLLTHLHSVEALWDALVLADDHLRWLKHFAMPRYLLTLTRLSKHFVTLTYLRIRWHLLKRFVMQMCLRDSDALVDALIDADVLA